MERDDNKSGQSRKCVSDCPDCNLTVISFGSDRDLAIKMAEHSAFECTKQTNK